MDPLNKNYKINDYYDENGNTVSISHMKEVLAANKIFADSDADWYNKFNRYGWIDLVNTDTLCTEFLFFTKPDLRIFRNPSYKTAVLTNELNTIPFFRDAVKRNRDALLQLNYSVPDKNGVKNPFMYLLSNAVTSKLDLPTISASAQESTPNIYGTTLNYRSHSMPSDINYDFSLSFIDTRDLEVYTMVKAYDEYMKLLKLGEVTPLKKYIISRCVPEQFSIYKFIIGSDGETILYYAKLTGVYFTDVPRSDFGDPGSDGFKYSLSFHAQFVEDNNPLIISEFNKISPHPKNSKLVGPYNHSLGIVDNVFVSYPRIKLIKRGSKYKYVMKWIK